MSRRLATQRRVDRDRRRDAGRSGLLPAVQDGTRRAFPHSVGRLLALALVLVVASAAQPAWADEDASHLVARLERDGDSVLTSFDVTSALTDAFRRRLSNGLTSRATIEMRLLALDDKVVAHSSRECRFQFDIWDERLEIRIRDGVQEQRTSHQKLIDLGLRDCGRIERARIASAAILPYRREYVLEVLVQLNPVSDEQLQRAREFMTNPRSTRGRPRTIFSAVARFFGLAPDEGADAFLFRARGLSPPGPRRDR